MVPSKWCSNLKFLLQIHIGTNLEYMVGTLTYTESAQMAQQVAEAYERHKDWGGWLISSIEPLR